MTDFYNELEISQSLGLDEIKKALARLSKVYEKRDADGFEGARKKLVLISEAEAVFKTESSRQRYDRELEASKSAPKSHDPFADRKADYQMWLDKAVAYHQNEQFDLAKSALEKAMQNRLPNTDEAEFDTVAAKIYLSNRDFLTALKHINDAIISDENDVSNYFIKFRIYEQLEVYYFNNRAEGVKYTINNRRPILAIAEKIAERNGDINEKALAYDLLAYAWWNGDNRDLAKGEEYAHKAIQTGLDCPNAKTILNAIQNNKKLAEEQKKRDEEAVIEKQRVFEQNRRNAEISKARSRKMKATKGLIFVLVYSLFIGSGVFSAYSMRIAQTQGTPYDLAGYVAILAIGIFAIMTLLTDEIAYVAWAGIGGFCNVVLWGLYSSHGGEAFWSVAGRALGFSLISIIAGLIIGKILKETCYFRLKEMGFF